MSEVTITKRVYLESKYLNHDIMNSLMKTLVESVKTECTKEHGHILSVRCILDILENEGNVFMLRFLAKTIKPEAGKQFTGKVCMVYRDGIFINIEDRQKMLIPATSLKGYTFDQLHNTYTKGVKIIQVGTIVNAVVTAAKYNKGNFSCFGSLKE